MCFSKFPATLAISQAPLPKSATAGPKAPHAVQEGVRTMNLPAEPGQEPQARQDEAAHGADRGERRALFAMNRHIVGVSAIVAALVLLGYAANTSTARRAASLPEEGFAIAQKAPAETAQKAPTDIAQAPTETAQARGSEDSVGQKLKEQIKAMLPSVGSNSAQKEAANWSREEWQIAEKAVADHRGGSKTANNNNTSARSELVWQPPEEIAGGRMNQSR